MGTARATISLQQETLDKAEKNAAQRGFKTSFSAYIAWLIERDSEGAVKREELEPTEPKPKAKRTRTRKKPN